MLGRGPVMTSQQISFCIYCLQFHPNEVRWLRQAAFSRGRLVIFDLNALWIRISWCWQGGFSYPVRVNVSVAIIPPSPITTTATDPTIGCMGMPSSMAGSRGAFCVYHIRIEQIAEH